MLCQGRFNYFLFAVKMAKATEDDQQTAPIPEKNTPNNDTNNLLPSNKVTSGSKINPFYKGPVAGTPPSTSLSANANGCHTDKIKVALIKTPQDSNQSDPQFSGKRSKPPAPYLLYLAQIGSGPIAYVPKKEEDFQQKLPSDKMPNPFNRLNQLKSSNKKKIQEKKRRADIIRQKNIAKKCDTEVLELSEEEKDDKNEKSDDDVIILPTEPDPIYSLDSSDDDQKDESNDLQEAIKRSLQDKVRSGSPENSNASDDFIGPNDRCRGLDDPFGEIDDEDLAAINKSVDKSASSNAIGRSLDESADARNRIFASNAIQFVRSTDADQTEPIPSTSKQAEQMQHNNNKEPIFAKPVEAQKPIKSYEVSENCIAAVDVYESESSDMPESIYGKGTRKNTEDATEDKSDSDISDVVVETANRSKRLTKRKTSGSNKESDHVDSDESDNAESTPVRSKRLPCSTPFIRRGIGIDNAMNHTPSAKFKKTNKPKSTAVNSDEEFISMLSCVVHETNESGETEKSAEQSKNESNSKLNKSIEPWVVTDLNVDETPVVEQPAKENTSWTVKDAVGEVDDEDMPDEIQLNVDEISSDSFNFNLADQLKNAAQTPTESLTPCVNEKEKQTNTEEDKEKEKVDTGEVPSRSLIVHPEIGWNEEMHCFYKKSWGGETFNSQALRASMSSNFFGVFSFCCCQFNFNKFFF